MLGDPRASGLLRLLGVGIQGCREKVGGWVQAREIAPHPDLGRAPRSPPRSAPASRSNSMKVGAGVAAGCKAELHPPGARPGGESSAVTHRHARRCPTPREMRVGGGSGCAALADIWGGGRGLSSDPPQKGLAPPLEEMGRCPSPCGLDSPTGFALLLTHFVGLWGCSSLGGTGVKSLSSDPSPAVTLWTLYWSPVHDDFNFARGGGTGHRNLFPWGLCLAQNKRL